MVGSLVTHSWVSCNHLGTAAVPNRVIPVTLPPGRLRLATRPSLTGSPLAVNTIGIVLVAALAACGEGSHQVQELGRPVGRASRVPYWGSCRICPAPRRARATPCRPR